MPEIIQTVDKFGACFADPPWGYDNFVHAKHGAAAAHYDELNIDELKAIPVPDWTAKKAFLFLWATYPKLPLAFEVMEAWQFDYVTAVPWVKTVPNSGTIRTGVGHWTQGAAELLLIGRRKKSGARRRTVPCDACDGKPWLESSGQPRCTRCKGKGRRMDGGPVQGLLVGDQLTFYSGRAKKHSRKPEELQSWIERITNGPYLELFATRPRSGWTTWGLATGYRLSSKGVERIEAALNPFGAHGRRSAG